MCLPLVIVSNLHNQSFKLVHSNYKSKNFFHNADCTFKILENIFAVVRFSSNICTKSFSCAYESPSSQKAENFHERDLRHIAKNRRMNHRRRIETPTDERGLYQSCSMRKVFRLRCTERSVEDKSVLTSSRNKHDS